MEKEKRVEMKLSEKKVMVCCEKCGVPLIREDALFGIVSIQCYQCNHENKFPRDKKETEP